MSNNLLQGKKGIVFGALDDKSIAWKVALEAVSNGAEIILTNTFGSRKRRLIENNLLNRYQDLNTIAGKIAKQAVHSSKKNVLII